MILNNAAMNDDDHKLSCPSTKLCTPCRIASAAEALVNYFLSVSSAKEDSVVVKV